MIDSAEIIRMAHVAGFSLASGFLMPSHTGHITHEIEAFAALVAAAQREIDAKLCDRLAFAIDNAGNKYLRPAYATDCAAAIRANKD